MRYYLDTQVGDGTQNNPFTAAHADYDVGLMGALRLGPSGLWLVGSTETSGRVLLDFGDTLDQTLPSNIRRALANRLGLTLDQTDLRGIIAELMLLHGREDGTRWRNFHQNTFGHHKIWLGGQVVYDAPIIRGTTLGDTFVETGGNVDLTAHTPTGPDAAGTWAYVTGDGVSGDVEVIAADDRAKETAADSAARYRLEADLATDDHYAEFDVINWAASTATSLGPIVRYSASAETWYGVLNRDRTSNTRFRIFEATAGSFATLATKSENLPTEPVTLRLEVNGSELDMLIDDVSQVTASDGSITGNTRTGVWMSNLADIDNFKAADLGPVTNALNGAVAAVAVATGIAEQVHVLTVSVVGVVETAGAGSQTHVLIATSSAVASAVGTLTVVGVDPVTGAAQAVAVAAGTPQQTHALVVTTNAVAETAAALEQTHALTAAQVAVASASGVLTIGGANNLVGAAQTVSVTTAALEQTHQLVVSVQTVATTTADLDITKQLNGAAQTVSSVTATVLQVHRLTVESVAVVQTTATLSVTKALTVDVQAVVQAVGTLTISVVVTVTKGFNGVDDALVGSLNVNDVLVGAVGLQDASAGSMGVDDA